MFAFDTVLELQSLPSMTIYENAAFCKRHSMITGVLEIKGIRVFRNLRCQQNRPRSIISMTVCLQASELVLVGVLDSLRDPRHRL
jgi:hypothetical protein